MTAEDRALQVDLIELATDATGDLMLAVASLMSAAAALLGEAIGDHAAGEAIAGAVREAVERARH